MLNDIGNIILWNNRKINIDIRRAQLNWKQYIEELEVYQLVRFKDNKMKMYDRWVEKTDAGDINYQSIANIVKRPGGKEKLYDIALLSAIENVGTFKYLNFDIPETNVDIKNLFDL